jgi:thiol-disulfide isomerase/thioredoxin
MMMKKLGFFVAMGMLVACQNNDVGSVVTAPAAQISSQQTSAESKPVASNKPRPELVIETFDGQHFDLAKHRDKWVAVNFWATWCAPCLKEIPDFNALAKKRSDLQFIGLAYEEISRADMQAFLKEQPVAYPIAVLDVYAPPSDFEIPRGLPMTVLIAPGGEVVQRFFGPVTAKALEAAIDHGK